MALMMMMTLVDVLDDVLLAVQLIQRDFQCTNTQMFQERVTNTSLGEKALLREGLDWVADRQNSG